MDAKHRQGEGRHRDGDLRARRGQAIRTPTNIRRSGACAAAACSRRTRRWQRGSWEGVTLSPPVVQRTLEVEGDLERDEGQRHHAHHGAGALPAVRREVEENIHVSPAKNEALVEAQIFMDRDARGYAYRLIVNHKKEGKLVLPVERQGRRRLRLRRDSRGAAEGRLAGADGGQGSGQGSRSTAPRKRCWRSSRTCWEESDERSSDCGGCSSRR